MIAPSKSAGTCRKFSHRRVGPYAPYDVRPITSVVLEQSAPSTGRGQLSFARVSVTMAGPQILIAGVEPAGIATVEASARLAGV